MPAPKRFAFICGADDFLVARAGKQRFEVLAEGATDDFSREIVNGCAANVAEVASAIARFREAVQTVPLFGGKRVIWLKDVNFLADTVTGRAEGTLTQVEDLQALLEKVPPDEVTVLITAAPVDRRRAFLKWCEKNADYALIGGESEGGADALAGVVAAEAQALGATFEPGAIELLLARIGANSRLLVEEVRKLAAYAGGAAITEAMVGELSPNVAEGDFFETAEAFFSGDLPWTLSALHRHFFAGGDARPILAALQNRNRILLQARALADAGEVRIGQRGVDGLSRAAANFRPAYAEAADTKSSFNIFSQNPWYLGKLVGRAKLLTVRRLIDHQRDFIAAFEEIIRRPSEQEEVLRDLAVRCLS